MGFISERKALLALAAVVVVADIAAIFVCFQTRKDRRKSTTAVMISLLLSDLLFGAILLPVRIADTCLSGYRNLHVFLYIYAYLLFLSAFNALFLSFDRYANVIKPLWRRLISTRTIARGLVLTWILPAIISVLPLTWTFLTGYNSSITKIYRYILLALLCFVFLAIISLQIRVLCGLYIYWSTSKKKSALRKTRGNGASLARKECRQRISSTVLFLSLITTSVVTWLPTIAYNIKPFPDLTSVSLFALMTNAMVDPLLIFAFNIKSMMKRLKSKKASARTTQTAKSRTNPAAKNQAIKLEHHSLEQAPLRTKT